MDTFLLQLPEDLKREVTRKVTAEKFKQVLQELELKVDFLKEYFDSGYINAFPNTQVMIRPTLTICYYTEKQSVTDSYFVRRWVVVGKQPNKFNYVKFARDLRNLDKYQILAKYLFSGINDSDRH
jgi:hypothetical protein